MEVEGGAQPLPAAALRRAFPVDRLGFETTESLTAGPLMVGQQRAVDAIRFGASIGQPGYNLFVIGASGLGRRTLVERLLPEIDAPMAPACDWCYVNHFADPQRPRALALPSGRAAAFKRDMQHWTDELRTAIPAAFESDEYRTRVARADSEFNERQQQAFEALGQRAAAEGIALLRTPAGFSFAPMVGQEVMTPESYRALAADEQKAIAAKVHRFEAELEEIVHSVMQWRRERIERVRALNQEVIELAVGQITVELRARYADIPDAAAFIDAARANVIERGEEFQRPAEPSGPLPGMGGRGEIDLRQYQVNVVVENAPGAGAPVVYEDNPTYSNLVGRVEHLTQFGSLVTDFSLIHAGSLHRANGGFLLVEAVKLLGQPYAWEGLKRALRAREIRIESLGQVYNLVPTLSLEPEPIRLDVKVVLFGPRMIYHALESLDPEFAELFRVAAEFAEDVEWDDAAALALAQTIAAIARDRGLRPFDRAAVGRVLEQAARIADDTKKFSVHLQSLEELLAESDFRAGAANRAVVGAEDVAAAIAAARDRASHVQERLHDAVMRDIVVIDTAGTAVGQVNGLAVYALGRALFGQPHRITATTRFGHGEVLDIQREVALGGPVHSKGVLTLAGFLGARFGSVRPLALGATLTFEQTYGPVDGDSASTAELCALLSSIADVPLRQDLAITGAINQKGDVQAIGGVNEKIEGFFDLCRARGLTGTQGVIIPAANRAHLMLREDVVAAAAAGQFHVYAVRHVDEAMALLTGVDVGELDAQGAYPPQSVNGRVRSRLERLERAGEARTVRMFGAARVEPRGGGRR